MADVSIPRRVVGTVLVASVQELDELAVSINGALDRAHVPSWKLRIPGYVESPRVRGRLADASGSLDLSRLRGFDLWLGSSADDRHATLSVDLGGIRADVWGETEPWAKEAAARVGHYLDRLRPWWWWLRLGRGAGAFSVLSFLLLSAGYGLFAVNLGLSFPYPLAWAFSGVSALAGGLLTFFAVPRLVVGERIAPGRLLVPLGLWIMGLLVAAVVGGYVNAIPLMGEVR